LTFFICACSIIFSIFFLYGCNNPTTGDSDTISTLSATDTISGTDIINNHFTVYLDYRPLPQDSVLRITRNGAPVTKEVDYAVPTIEASTREVIPPARLAYITDPCDYSNGYATGTVLYTGTIEATDLVTIEYSYYKWNDNRYSGSGAAGVLKYVLTDQKGIIPGTELVYIWSKSLPLSPIVALTRDSSIETYDGQYYINYTDPPYITFTTDPIVKDSIAYPLSDINFTVIFKHTQ